MDSLKGSDVLERLSRNFRNHAKDVGPDVRTRPPEVYLDPARYAREAQKLFREQPLVVGHISQLRNSGDFFTTSILGLPLLIVRDEQGSLNAFVNACRHRGAIVETAPCGNRRDFTCPYHAWNYGADGALRYIPDHASFAGAGLENAGLCRLPLAEKHGLIFVRTAPGESDSLEIDLGEMGEQFDSLGLADHDFFRTETFVRRLNWKLAVDGSLETYHLNCLHPQAAKLFTGAVSIFDYYGPHVRFVTARRSLKDIGQEDLAAADLRQQAMFTYQIFPNTFVTAPHDHLILLSFLPQDINSCAMVYTLLTPKGADPALARHWESTWKHSLSVLSQDFDVEEGIQRAYEAGFSAPAVFGRFEHAIARFHDLCDAAIEAGPVAPR